MINDALTEHGNLHLVVALLEKLSIKLQDKQLWDCLTDCEQIKVGIQKWMAEYEQDM